MKIEITKAKSLKIKKGENYIVIVEADHLTKANAEVMKEQIVKKFKSLEANALPMILIKGKMIIAKVEQSD